MVRKTSKYNASETQVIVQVRGLLLGFLFFRFQNQLIYTV